MADDAASTPPPKLKTCFVASPIGDAGSPIRWKADAFLKFIVTPATKALGYADPVRADHIAEPGVVTSQIVRSLIDADVVIVDLTDRNPNVMYELAIRHAAQKPFVQLMTKGQDIPFDVGQSRTIAYDITNPYSIEEAVAELKRHLEICSRDNFQAETPLGRMLDIGKIVATGPRDEVLEKVLAKLDSIESRMPRESSAMQALREGELENFSHRAVTALRNRTKIFGDWSLSFDGMKGDKVRLRGRPNNDASKVVEAEVEWLAGTDSEVARLAKRFHMEAIRLGFVDNQ